MSSDKESKTKLFTSHKNDETQSLVPTHRSGNDCGKKSDPDSHVSSCIDNVLIFLGWIDPYQRIRFLLLMLPIVDSAIHSISFIFIGNFVDHKCALDNQWISEDNNITVEECRLTVTNNSKVIFSGACPNGYEYTEPRDRSFVSEWDLVCDKEALSDTSQTVMSVGAMVGAFLSTTMADKLGRKPVYVISHILLLLVAVATAFAPDFYTFLGLRFLLGGLQQSINLTSWILLIEWIPTLKREWPCRVGNFVWPVGLLLMGLICYLCRDMSWRFTELILAAVSCYSLIEWCLQDESLRWLTVKGRIGEVERIIMKAAKRNGVQVKEALEIYRFGERRTSTPTETDCSMSLSSHLNKVDDIAQADKIQRGNSACSYSSSESSASDKETETDPGFSAFVKNKHILLVTVIISYIWLADSLSYVILTITADSLTDNFYLGYTLSIFVELPAGLFFIVFVSRIGRLTWVWSSNLIAGLSLLLALLLQNLPQTANLVGVDVMVLVLSLLAKFGTTMGFNILWLYTPELFPTTIRSTGLGVASLVSKIASLVAPFARTLNRHCAWAPGAVLTGFCLTIPLLVPLMPETYGCDLPQTVAEMELWLAGKSKKPTDQMKDEEGVDNKAYEEIGF